jgi:glucose-6-phosphate isomerase
MSAAPVPASSRVMPYPPRMLTIEFANCLAERIGAHGLDPTTLDPAADTHRTMGDLTRRLARSRGQGWERWRELPHGELRRQNAAAVRQAVEQCRGRAAAGKPAFENVVVLGIGGSALGNIALQAALNPPTYNLLPGDLRPGPRIFVIDNVDPTYFGAFLKYCQREGRGGGTREGLQRTLFNIISKSGETAETAAQFMVIRDLLRQHLGDEHRENIIAITDPASGTMRQICDREGYATLPVPEGVGGRFSVLSPVGLFSAAMAGIDIESLLDGAAEMDALCSREELLENPAALLAFLLVELGTAKGKSCHVMMPYSNALYLMADWFRQLWAESLGKQTDLLGSTVYAGFTPIKALGATDQHSQVQLYREGPNDKVFMFLEVDLFDHDITIPPGLGVDALSYLEGKSMATLLNAEKRATEYALVESQRPNLTIRFPRIDARHIGQFIYLWEVATAYAGLLLNIDAYNQPAVETGKLATFGLMGRAGYEKYKGEVEKVLGAGRWRVGGDR